MSPEENIKIVRRAFEAFNTGNTSDVHLFIGPDYIDRESQSHKDSYRSKLKGPEEFVDYQEFTQCISGTNSFSFRVIIK